MQDSSNEEVESGCLINLKAYFTVENVRDIKEAENMLEKAVETNWTVL
jgi:hypothetical protein